MPEPTINPEEAEWIRQAQAGDDAAYGRLVHAFQGPVYNLCYRMLGEAQEAEDAAQETFLRAYRHLDGYDPKKKFINWLLSIASNHCVDRLRKRRLTLVPLEALKFWDPPRSEAHTPEPSIARQEMEAEVHGLLGELGGKDRAAIVLRYWYDLSYREIAETLGLTESAVKSRLHRARQRLAEAWQAHESAGLEGSGRRDEAPTL